MKIGKDSGIGEIGEKTILYESLSEAAMIQQELATFFSRHKSFVNCRENLIALNDYLVQRSLAPSYPHLKQAYEELLQAGMLHTTPPEPQPRNYVPPKGKIAPYRGSHYDRTQILKLRGQIAQMTSNELTEFLAVNGWDDFPAWLCT